MNIPVKLVASLGASRGDSFEIYSGEKGVFIVGRSADNDDPTAPNTTPGTLSPTGDGSRRGI